MNAQTHDFGLSLQPQTAPELAEGWLSRRLSNRSIKQKLRIAIMGIACVPFAAILVLLTLFAYFGKAGSDHSERVRTEVNIAQATLSVASASNHLLQASESQNAAYLARAKAEYRAATNFMQMAIETGEKRFPQANASTMKNALVGLEGEASLVAELSLASSKQEFRAARATAAQKARALGALFGETQTYAKQVIDRLLDQIVIAFLVSLAFALLVGCAVLFGANAIVTNIAEMIQWMKQTMESLAQGDTQVSIPGADRPDDLGAMARALSVFRRSTLELQQAERDRAKAAEQELQQARNLAGLRQDKAQALRKLADDFEASIFGSTRFVAEASGELQATSAEMATLAKQSSAQVNDAAKAMEKANVGISATASASDQFALSISEISQQAAASAAMARDVKSSVTTANGKIAGLSQSVERIGEITELIGSIAARTNLLSLNASIEAARGGEAGRGFAVVAAEVKELAGRTAHAANNVSAMVAAISGTTKHSVEGLAKVGDQIARLEESAVSIAAAVDQQSVSGRELAHSIDTVATSSDAVSTTLGEVRGSSLEVGSAAEQMLKSSEKSQRHAEQLREQAVHFLSEVREGYRVMDKPSESAAD